MTLLAWIGRSAPRLLEVLRHLQCGVTLDLRHQRGLVFHVLQMALANQGRVITKLGQQISESH